MHRLSFVATLADAAQGLAAEWKALLRETTVPALLWVASVVLDRRWEPTSGDGAAPVHLIERDLLDLLVGLVGMAALAMVGVTCARLVILGADSLPRRWGLAWSRSMTSFLGWMIAMSFAAAFFFMLMLPLTSMNAPLFVAVMPLIAGYYMAVRLSLVFPASAIGQRIDWGASWALTTSNGGRLAVLLLPAIFGPFYLFVRAPTVADALGIAAWSRGTVAYEALLGLMMLIMWSGGMLLLSRAFRWFVANASPVPSAGAPE